MAAGQTAVTYNGVTIYNCQTLVFDQSPVYDTSDTTLLYTVFRIRVSGYVHPQGSGTVGTSATHASSASAVHGTIREMLVEPRRNFEFRTGTSALGAGGTVLLQATKASRVARSTSDLNNGPKPRDFSISSIAGDHLFRVEFEIELALNECLQPGTEVLSNRWQSQDTIDANQFTVRTYQGVLRLASAAVNPHNLRGWVVPPLQPGMRRESMSFVSTPDGLTLNYTITDREVLYAAPSPGYSWDVTHRETASENGIVMTGRVDVSVEGDRYADQKALLRIAAAVAERKLLFAGGGFNENLVMLLSYDAVTHQGSSASNRVAVSAHYMRRPNKAPDGRGRNLVATEQLGEVLDPTMFDGVLGGDGAPIQYDPDRSPGGRTEESPYLSGAIPVVGATVAYMQQQCGTDEPVRPIAMSRPAFDGAVLSGNDLPTLEVRVSDTVTDELDPRYSIEHNEAIYTNYQTQSDYHEEEQTVQLPVAGETGNWDSSIYDHDTGEYKSGIASSFVALGPRQTKRVIRIDAERVGQEPKLPTEQFKYDDPELSATMYLIGKKIRQMGPVPQANGNYLYRTVGEWVFGTDRPVKAFKKQPPATLDPSQKTKNGPTGVSFFGPIPFVYDVDRYFMQDYGDGNKH